MLLGHVHHRCPPLLLGRPPCAIVRPSLHAPYHRQHPPLRDRRPSCAVEEVRSWSLELGSFGRGDRFELTVGRAHHRSPPLLLGHAHHRCPPLLLGRPQCAVARPSLHTPYRRRYPPLRVRRPPCAVEDVRSWSLELGRGEGSSSSSPAPVPPRCGSALGLGVLVGTTR